MRLNKICLLCCFVLLVSTVNAADVKQAANDVCQCLKEPFALLERLLPDFKAAEQTGEFSKLMQAQGEMMNILATATVCLEDLSTRYPNIEQNAELKAEVMAITDRQCPNPMRQK